MHECQSGWARLDLLSTTIQLLCNATQYVYAVQTGLEYQTQLLVSRTNGTGMLFPPCSRVV